MFKTIVVGLDGSERQPAVLRAAKELAQAAGGQLHLCRAMQIPVSVPAIAWSLKGDEFAAFLIEHGTQAMHKLEDDLPAELHGSTVCRIGQPADVLIDVAQDVKADLVIIGSHGYDRVDRLLGTTAAKVANRAPCSVMVVR